MTIEEVTNVFGREFKKLSGRKEQSWRTARSEAWHGELRQRSDFDGLPFNVRFGFADDGNGGLEEIGFKYEKFGNKPQVDRSLELLTRTLATAYGEGKLQSRESPSQYPGTEPDEPNQAKRDVLKFTEWGKDLLYIRAVYFSMWLNALMKTHQITVSFSNGPVPATE